MRIQIKGFTFDSNDIIHVTPVAATYNTNASFKVHLRDVKEPIQFAVDHRYFKRYFNPNAGETEHNYANENVVAEVQRMHDFIVEHMSVKVFEPKTYY